MEMLEVGPGVLAFVHPEGRSNCGMIHTSDGVVMIDTTAREMDIRSYLEMADVSVADVCQVLLTHSHSDHTSGIPIFKCPVLAHKLTRQRIIKRGTDRSKTQVPTDTFEGRQDLEIGGVGIEFIHTGGHTPGSSVVWLPDSAVLFSGDLIFEGRYPFLATANVQVLLRALQRLLLFNARVIVPGHGVLCAEEEIHRHLAYIQGTWKRASEHIAQGHSLEETLMDTDFPRCAERGFEKLHDWNIKVAYRQASKAAA